MAVILSTSSTPATALNNPSICPGEKTTSMCRGGLRRITPGMRHAPLDGNACAGGRVPSPVADRDVERAFQHDEMLLLLAVDVQRHAVVRIGHDLDDGIGAHRLRRGDADL